MTGALSIWMSVLLFERNEYGFALIVTRIAAVAFLIFGILDVLVSLVELFA